MSSGIKPHTTVIITRKMLEALGACEFGLDNVADMLPVTLSTDVDANLDLACELVQSPRFEHGWPDVAWLRNRLSYVNGDPGNVDHWPDDETLHTVTHDAWYTAQILAWIADYLATKEGR